MKANDMSQHILKHTLQGCVDYNYGKPLYSWRILAYLKTIKAKADADLVRSLAYLGLALFLAISAAVIIG